MLLGIKSIKHVDKLNCHVRDSLYYLSINSIPGDDRSKLEGAWAHTPNRDHGMSSITQYLFSYVGLLVGVAFSCLMVKQ